MNGKPGSRRWLVCIGAMLMLFCAGGLIISAFSIYLPYIVSSNGFTNTQTSSLLTIRSFAGLVMILVSDAVINKVGLHISSGISIVFAAAGLFLYGSASNYTGYCAAAVLCGAGFGLACIAAPLLIEGWFIQDRGLALGIATAGTGIASIISPVILVPVIESYSLSTAFYAEAVFVAVCAAVVFLLVRNPEKETVKSQEHSDKKLALHTSKIFALGRGAEIALYAAVFLGGLIVFGITAAMPPLFEELYGGTNMSMMTSVFGMALMGGKVIYGRLVDKKGSYHANYFLFILLFIGMAGVVITRSIVLAFVSAVCLGLGAPLNNLGFPTYAKEFCKDGMYAKAVKVLTLTGNIAGIAIGFLAGLLADIFHTYISVFIMLTCLVVICGILIQSVYKSRKP